MASRLWLRFLSDARLVYKFGFSDTLAINLQVMIMSKLSKTAEVILVICVFSFVFCCFSVPIIIYATNARATSSQDIGVDIGVDNCPQQVSIITYLR